MKVLAFADFPSPYRVEVFKGLSKEYELHVVFDKMSDQNRSSEWFCRNTGLNSISLLTKDGQEKFKQILNNIRDYDLVLAYDYHIKNAIKLEIQCMLYKVPYIMNLDGAFIRKNHIKNLIKRFLIKGATGYFASGTHAIEYFKYFGAKSDKIYIHPFTSLHATDMLDDVVSQEEKQLYRKELNIPNKKTVLTIGQFIPRKGFDILIKAWSKELDDKAQLIIIGGGDEEGYYRKLIKENKSRNIILNGFKQREEIFKYYKAADLFVLPTREDIWGLVINEAMACGLPVISTNMCLGALELLDKRCIVPTENVQQLNRKMEIFIDDENLRNSQAINNLKNIRSYTYENVVRSHVYAISEIFK